MYDQKIFKYLFAKKSLIKTMCLSLCLLNNDKQNKTIYKIFKLTDINFINI